VINLVDDGLGIPLEPAALEVFVQGFYRVLRGLPTHCIQLRADQRLSFLQDLADLGKRVTGRSHKVLLWLEITLLVVISGGEIQLMIIDILVGGAFSDDFLGVRGASSIPALRR
jgi:hypothetical protein